MGVVALGVVAGKMRHVGRGSPRRGSRKKETEINRAHKKPTTRNPVVEIHPVHIRNPWNSPFHLFDGFLFAI